MLTVTDFTKARNFSELRELYKKEGKTFASAGKLYRKAVKDWFELNKDKISQAPEGLPEELPGKTIDLNGISYHINGVTHFNVPGKVRHYYSKQLEDKLVAYESGLDTQFDMGYKNVYCMRDFSAFSLEVSTSNLIALIIAPLMKIPIHTCPYYEIFFKQPSAILKLRAKFNATYLPLPLEMEYAQHNTSAFTYNLRFGRSMYMTEYLRQLAEHKGAKEIHALVGLSHEVHIAHYLENKISSPKIEKLATHYLAKELAAKGEI